MPEPKLHAVPVGSAESMLLAAALAAFPLAGALAQAVDTGKSTGSANAGAANKMGDAKSDGAGMKSTAPGYQDKTDVSSGIGKSPGNAATGQQEKK